MNSNLITIIQSIAALAIVIVLIYGKEDIQSNILLKSTMIVLIILHVCIGVYGVSFKDKDNNNTNNPIDREKQ